MAPLRPADSTSLPVRHPIAGSSVPNITAIKMKYMYRRDRDMKKVYYQHIKEYLNASHQFAKERTFKGCTMKTVRITGEIYNRKKSLPQ